MIVALLAVAIILHVVTLPTYPRRAPRPPEGARLPPPPAPPAKRFP